MRRAALLLLSGLSFTCGIADLAFAQTPGVVRISARDPFGAHIVEAAQRFQLPAAWIRAILAAESNGNVRAVSPKGAMGLMQLMPATWRDLRIQHRLGVDPFDPHDNIIAGAAFIRLLYDRYGSPGWIAAYNAGPGRYEASLRGRALPSETRAYVAAIAPNLGGDNDPGVTLVAATDPRAWTRSALFVAQGSSNAAADPAPVKPPPDELPTRPTVRDVSAIVPQTNGLFVARLGRGMAQ
jgi:soluble lytic murein transglycosylase-like protein